MRIKSLGLDLVMLLNAICFGNPPYYFTKKQPYNNLLQTMQTSKMPYYYIYTNPY